MTDSGGLLNDSAWRLTETICQRIDDLRGRVHTLDNGSVVLDLGVDVDGGLEAGLELSRLCLAGRGHVTITAGPLPTDDWPTVEVASDTPVMA